MSKKTKYTYMQAPRAASVFDLLPARPQECSQSVEWAHSTVALHVCKCKEAGAQPLTDTAPSSLFCESRGAGVHQIAIARSRRIAPRLVPTQRGQRELIEAAVSSRDGKAQALEELERDAWQT